MASSKNTFEAYTFLANNFASAMWRGTGATINTFGIFTVTNITLTRTLNLATATINDVANLLGTVIYDVQEGLWDGSNYTITNGNTDRAYDADDTSLAELLDVLGTAIADNPSTTTWFARNYTATNYTADYVLDCAVTSLEEIADVLGTFLDWRRPDIPGLEYTMPLSRFHFTTPQNQFHFTAADEDG